MNDCPSCPPQASQAGPSGPPAWCGPLFERGPFRGYAAGPSPRGTVVTYMVGQPRRRTTLDLQFRRGRP